MTDQTFGAPGQPAAASTAAASTAAASTAAAPPASPIPWLQGADDLTVGYVQNKGWDSPAKMLDSYRALEKTFGADRAGNTVVLPKEGAPQADLDAFYNRLGRPATPDGYKIPVPEGADPAFSKAAAQWFFEQGVPAKAAEGLAAKWNDYQKQQATAIEQARVSKFEDEDRALRQKWGAAFDQNLEQARAFVRGMGVEGEVIDQLSESMGHLKTMEFFQALGAKMGEADFVSGQSQSKFGQALTPQQALAKIVELQRDSAWVAKYLGGDVDAKAEMRRLQSFAHPEAG